jgi:cysteinyl-tRNA synthetase
LNYQGETVLISCPWKLVLRLYNTATRKVEEFKPINPDKVGMYVCGLTVYNDMHLGHARTYISFDVIRRWLEYSGYEVTFVQNHTDIDDKIIQKSNEEDSTTEEIASRYIERTMEDLEKLQVRPPTFMPKATDFIKEMIEIVSDLVEKKHAYVVEPAAGALSPDVYFDISSVSDMFGTLTGQNIEDMEAGARVAVDSRNAILLTLSCGREQNRMNPVGKALGAQEGPGWHIECSAMSLGHLGKHFDIHGGGVDLKFPHHESEILQTECHTNHSPVANYWIHTGFLTIDKEKMSKSLDNFFLVRDIMKEYSAPILRFYLLNGSYRSPIDFSNSSLKESMAAYKRLEGTYRRFRDEETNGDQKPPELVEAIEQCRKDFVSAMNDDFNTREAIASLFQLARIANNHSESSLTSDLRSELVKTFDYYGNQVLGLFTEHIS